jgi:autotransporter-associated beta strand protein
VDNGSSTFSGVIANSSSTGNLVKAGTGTITLSGTNTFTGGVTISLGALRITRAAGLGSGTKTITLKATADKMLELDGTSGNITLPSTISFLTSGVNGAIRNIAGTNTIAGAFTISDGNGNTKIISDGGALTLSGNISANVSARILDLSGTSTAANTFSGALANTNTPGLTKTGTGTWTLSGANTYAGATTVTAGTLKLAHNSALGTTAAGTTVSTGAKLQLEGTTLTIPEPLTLGTGSTGVTIENLSGNNTLSGAITRNGALNFLSNTGKLTISSPIGNTNNTVNLQGDGDGEISGAITLAFSVTKSGNGTWKLSGPSTYTTATTISGGRLILSGSLTSPVTATTGTLAPQGTPATTGSLSINSTGRLEVRPGDTLTVGGTVTLGGNLDIIAPPGLATGTSYTILNKTSAGAVTGTFAGKPQGSTFTASGYTWQISYLGGDGNDTVITIPIVLSALETWRQLHFGTTSNTGNAADTFDANNDGETNLIEFATGQSPHAATRAVTSLVKTPTGLEFTYIRNQAAFDQGYLFDVQHSDTLAPNSWTSAGPGTVLPEAPTQTVRALIPEGTTGRRFVRLKITAP